MTTTPTLPDHITIDRTARRVICTRCGTAWIFPPKLAGRAVDKWAKGFAAEHRRCVEPGGATR